MRFWQLGDCRLAPSLVWHIATLPVCLLADRRRSFSNIFEYFRIVSNNVLLCFATWCLPIGPFLGVAPCCSQLESATDGSSLRRQAPSSMRRPTLPLGARRTPRTEHDRTLHDRRPSNRGLAKGKAARPATLPVCLLAGGRQSFSNIFE